MSTPKSSASNARDALTQELLRAIYENSTAAVFFHAVIAQQAGLGPTEEKTLLILNGAGSLTAGEIAAYTGLTTSSVTSLIDRLESKGFVRRVRDPHDRRKVIVEPDREKFAELAQLFGALNNRLVGMLAEYSEKELALLTRFLDRATADAREVIAALSRKLERDEER